MEYRKQEFGGGSKEKDFLVKYESYLVEKISLKYKSSRDTIRFRGYLGRISRAKTIDELDKLAEEWGFEKLQK